MASRSPLGHRGTRRRSAVTMHENEVSVVLPLEGYTNVARLVAGGFLSRCDFPYEAIDDVQLAIDLILRSVPLSGTQATVRLVADADGLTVTVGELPAASAGRVLTAVVRDGLELGTVLERLVDAVELVDEEAPRLVMRKAHEAVSR